MPDGSLKRHPIRYKYLRMFPLRSPYSLYGAPENAIFVTWDLTRCQGNPIVQSCVAAC